MRFVIIAMVWVGCAGGGRAPVMVMSNLEGGQIVVDGRAAGAVTPATIVVRGAGDHVVSVVAPDGRRSSACRIRVARGGWFTDAWVKVVVGAAMLGPEDDDLQRCDATFAPQQLRQFDGQVTMSVQVGPHL